NERATALTPPVSPPPAGTYMPPHPARQAPPAPPPPLPGEAPAIALGTLDLCVEPATADVRIDGSHGSLPNRASMLSPPSQASTVSRSSRMTIGVSRPR